MIPLPRFLLLWAALPAVALSLWFLHIVEAPRSAQILQVVAMAVGAAIFAALVRTRRIRLPGNSQWLALSLALSLFIPLLANAQSGPDRWLVLGGARLYVASVVLPVTLLLLGAPSVRAPGIYALSVIAASAALVLQPDASQMSAFAIGMLALLVASSFQLRLRLALLAVLLSCTVIAWRIPDPLAPVRHVEGVFSLAAEVSPLALVAALTSAILPLVALAWTAWRMRSSGVFAVAVYYASLYALAPLQVTPVPLLGFGAGPILGYFLVAGIVSRARHEV